MSYFKYLFNHKNIIEREDVKKIEYSFHENSLTYSGILILIPDTLDSFGAQYFIKKIINFYHIKNIDLRIVDELDNNNELVLDRYNFNFEKYNLVFLLNCDYTTNFVNDKNNNDILRKTIRIVNYSNQSNHIFDDYYVNITNNSDIKIAITAICYMLAESIISTVLFDKNDEFIVETIDNMIEQNNIESKRKKRVLDILFLRHTFNEF